MPTLKKKAADAVTVQHGITMILATGTWNEYAVDALDESRDLIVCEYIICWADSEQN